MPSLLAELLLRLLLFALLLRLFHCLRAGVDERSWLLPLGFESRLHRCGQARDQRFQYRYSLLSYCGLDKAEVRAAGVGLGVGLGCVTPRTLFASCFWLGLGILERKLRGSLGLVPAGHGVRVRFENAPL